RWMYYPRVLASNLTLRQRRAYELTLPHHFQRQAGLFPTTCEFMHSYSNFFIEQARQLDCLGLFLQDSAGDMEERIVRAYQLTNKFIYYGDQEPDRSIPDYPANCYLL